MTNTLLSLLVKLNADASQLKSELDGAEKQAKKSAGNITSGLSKIGGAIVLGGIAAVGASAIALGGALIKSVEAASEAQDITAQLEAVLAKTGSTTGVTAKQVNDLANSFSRTTKFEDDLIVSAGGVLARFDKIGKDTMPKAMQATLDLAQSMGIDLTSAATMVGKVLQTPGEGMMRLKAAGVALTDEQTNLIQSLFDTGKTAEAQDMILQALSGTMGGAAQAAGSTFSGQLAILKNSLGNVSETIGGALLPILTNLASTLIEKLNSPETQAWIANLTAGITSLASQVVIWIPAVIDWFTQAFDYLKNNQGIIVGILAALGVAVGAFVYLTVIPAIGTLIGILAGPIAVMALVGAAAYLLYQAWTNNWGGIRDTLTALWEGTLKPAFETIRTWLQVNIPIALAWLSNVWTTVLLPAIQAVWSWISTVLIPFFQNTVVPWLQEKITAAIQILSNFWSTVLWPAIQSVYNWISTVLIPFFQNVIIPWLQVTIPAAIQTLSDFWNKTLLPAIKAVWDFINTYILPIFATLVDVGILLLKVAIGELSILWTETLLPAITKIYNWFNEKVLPILKDVRDFIRDEIGPKIQWFIDSVITPLATALSNITTGALQWILDKLTAFRDMLANIKLPDWLTPGSPTPFELGIRGIASALADLNRFELPAFQAELSAIGAVGGGDNSRITNITVNPHYYRGSEPTLMDELATIGAFSRA